MKFYRDKARPRGMHRQVFNLTEEEVFLFALLVIATGGHGVKDPIKYWPMLDRRLIK